MSHLVLNPRPSRRSVGSVALCSPLPRDHSPPLLVDGGVPHSLPQPRHSSILYTFAGGFNSLAFVCLDHEHLRRLLLRRRRLLSLHILIEIRRIMHLASHTLDILPHTLRRRRDILSVGHSITPSTHLPDHALHKRALRYPRPQKDSIDHQQDPAALLEQDGGTQDPEPEEHLQRSDDRHTGVVVVLNKATDVLAEG